MGENSLVENCIYRCQAFQIRLVGAKNAVYYDSVVGAKNIETANRYSAHLGREKLPHSVEITQVGDISLEVTLRASDSSYLENMSRQKERFQKMLSEGKAVIELEQGHRVVEFR